MSDDVVARLKRGDLPLDFNWNRAPHPDVPLPSSLPAEPGADQIRRVQLVAEDLRDGLHGVTRYPCGQEMLDYAGALAALGVTQITLGIYTGGKKTLDGVTKELLAKLRDSYAEITPRVLCLTTADSLAWLAECKMIHPRLEAIVFMGSAPSRFLVEEWDQAYVLRRMAWAIEEAVVRYGIAVIGATEHTTQTPPDLLREIIRTQVEHGAQAICLADTIGVARPIGTLRIVQFVQRVLRELGAAQVLIEWHGHRDLGNDLANALTAMAAGVDRIHTVARGIGERAGNTQLEAVLLNCAAILAEAGAPCPWQLEQLTRVLRMYDALADVPEPAHGPLSQRSHTTSLGIHTAAMLKAARLAQEADRAGDATLARQLDQLSAQIYTAVNPAQVGKHHTIIVGPWSGASTVRLAYNAWGGNGRALSPAAVERILAVAEARGRELESAELRALFAEAIEDRA